VSRKPPCKLLQSACAAVLATIATSAPAQPVLRQNFTAISVPALDLENLTVREPPDTMGAVGLHHYVQFLNGTFSIYNKSDHAELLNITDEQFWTNAGVDLSDPDHGVAISDPRVIWDSRSKRWFASMIDVHYDVDETTGGVIYQTNNNILVGVSNTSDPRGQWTGFRIQGDVAATHLSDFDRLGLDAKGVYVAVDNYQITPEVLQTVTILSIPKSDLTSATPTITHLTRFDNLDPNVVGQAGQPVLDFGPIAPRSAYLAADANDLGKLVRTSILGSDSAAATISGSVTIVVPPTTEPPKARQPDNGGPLETNDERLGAHLMRVGNSLWAVHAIGYPTTSRNPRGAIRWYQFDESTNTPIQPPGTIFDSTHDYYFPSIAANQFGDVVIGFTRSSLDEYPSAYAIVGATDSATHVTTFGDPILLKAGVQAYDFGGLAPNRWGDYSSTHVDPADPFIFWTIQEWSDEDSQGFGFPQWATQVAEIIIPHANEARWTNSASGAFSDPNQWLLFATPTAADHVIFSVATDPDLPDPYIVTLDANTATNRLSVRQGHLRLDLGGNTYSLTNTSPTTPSLSIGEYGGDPNFELTNGTLNSVHASIGAGDTADATLSLSSATWNNSGSIQVGSPLADQLGLGHLLIQSGGTLNIGASLAIAPASNTSVLPGGSLSAANVSNDGDFSTAGSLSISAAFTNTGNATFAGTQNWATGSQLDVRRGLISMVTNPGTPSTAASPAQARLTLHIHNDTATVALQTSIDLKNLIMDLADPGLQSLDLNSPAAPGQYNALRLYADDLTSARAALNAYIRHAIDFPGDGLSDSGLSGGGHPSSAIGVARLPDAHGDDHILVRLTRIGDLNLDGAVTISDFIDLASHFNSSGATWQDGDLNYDGQVTISDFIDLASNFGATYSGAVLPLNPADAQLLSDFASSHGASVPEPSLLALTTPLLLLPARRRRRL
jgi:hypothetical protein